MHTPQAGAFGGPGRARDSVGEGEGRLLKTAERFRHSHEEDGNAEADLRRKGPPEPGANSEQQNQAQLRLVAPFESFKSLEPPEPPEPSEPFEPSSPLHERYSTIANLTMSQWLLV